MRLGLQIFGLILFMIGLLFTFTIIGAFIGIPMMIAGSIMAGVSLFVGGSKTQITNVIHVTGGQSPGTPNPASMPPQSVLVGEPVRPSMELPRQSAQQLSLARFCSNCGTAVADAGSAFCAHCGSKL